MRYAGIIKNDFAAAPGVCTSVYLQGCPHHCKNCFNPETWDFEGGRLFTEETMSEIIAAIGANDDVTRSLCILGGEPLCLNNCRLTLYIIEKVKEIYPNIPVAIWTGYLLEELQNSENDIIQSILKEIDILIDGKFEEDKKDLTLKMRGSSNQRIIYFKNNNIYFEK